MKLGTSVRFLFPTSPPTHERFRGIVASMPKGAFIERPMGAYSPDEQARNLMEVASAARAAGLDALLTGDSHAAHPAYAATFSPLPTVARLMSVTGDMPIGVVLLAPFYCVMVRHIVGDHQLMLRSFERIGRDVMPQIRHL